MLAPFDTRSTGILVLPGNFLGCQSITLPVNAFIAKNQQQTAVTPERMQPGQKSGSGFAA
jgi:hypothetical protein